MTTLLIVPIQKIVHIHDCPGPLGIRCGKETRLIGICSLILGLCFLIKNSGVVCFFQPSKPYTTIMLYTVFAYVTKLMAFFSSLGVYKHTIRKYLGELCSQMLCSFAQRKHSFSKGYQEIWTRNQIEEDGSYSSAGTSRRTPPFSHHHWRYWAENSAPGRIPEMHYILRY